MTGRSNNSSISSSRSSSNSTATSAPPSNTSSSSSAPSAPALASSHAPIQLYDASAVKGLLDDTIKNIVLDHKFKESFTLIDTRIALSALAILLALFALVWGFVVPFPANTTVVGACVVGYFVLMIALTFYTFYVEADTIMLARNKSGLALEIASSLPRFDHQYTIHIKATKPNSATSATTSLTKSIGVWFHSNGLLAEKTFEADVQSLLQLALSAPK